MNWAFRMCLRRRFGCCHATPLLPRMVAARGKGCLERGELLFQLLHARPGASEDIGLGVEFLAAHHIQTSQGRLQEGARIFVRFRAQCRIPDQLIELAEHITNGRRFQSHDGSLPECGETAQSREGGDILARNVSATMHHNCAGHGCQAGLRWVRNELSF